MTRSLALAALAVAVTANAADIQKCADAAGRITYQDAPCPRGSTIGTVPRDSARADPAALRELARQRQRLERAVDAQLAAQQQLPQPAPLVIATTGAAGETVYSYATPYPYTAIAGASTGTAAAGATQTADAATGTAASAVGAAITQPPAVAPATVTQLPVGAVTTVPQLPAIAPVPGAASVAARNAAAR